MVKIVDKAGIESVRTTSDGYLVADVRVARTGVQRYAAAELGLPGGGLVNVYRPESTVFSKDSMATFSGKPVTLLHPPEPVDASNWKKYAVGDVGEEIARDGDFIRVPIKIMDAATIEAIEGGTKELSVGYNVDVAIEDGVTPEGEKYQAIQRGHLKVNHIAVVPRARGGQELRIGDGVEEWGASPVTERKEKVSDTPLKTVVVGDEAVLVTDAGAKAIELLKGQLDEAHHKVGELKAALIDAESKILTDEQYLAKVADRVALEKSAAPLLGDADLSKMTEADIKKAVVVKRLGDEAVEGVSDAEISGMFKAVLATPVKAADPVRNVIMNRDASVDASNGRRSYEARMAAAWKNVK